MEFAKTKEHSFNRWCSSKIVGSDHAKLRQLMLVEEFICCINSDGRAFLNAKEVENLDLAARLADDYSLTLRASRLCASEVHLGPWWLRLLSILSQ